MTDGDTLTDVQVAAKALGKLSPRPHLLLALECDRPLSGSARHALSDVDEVVVGRGPARGAQRRVEEGRRRLTLRVADRWMSSTHARLVRGDDGWSFEDAGSKNGSQLNGEPATRAPLHDGDLIELGHTLFLFRAGLPTSADEPADLEAARTSGLATLVPSLSRELAALAQVARSTVPVCIHGETGTGKEVAARSLHALAGRSGAFVAINCGALPPNLVESELFGHKKGAFSGAVEDRPGLVKSADGGTLFLDEIGDLPLPSQAAFLRVLQEREVVPVGGHKPVKVDIRLVSATHHDLDAQVARGEFRGDLYARLSGFTLRLPPLRQRREDLGLLVGELLRREVPERGGEVAFTGAAARALYRYDWPFNVRELGKALAAAVALAGGRLIDVEQLPAALRGEGGAIPPSLDDEPSAPLDGEDAARREELLALLERHRGNVSQVAREMSRARMQILRWVKRYRIDLDKFRQ
jgi:DNA-binding NtrC family response regulator